MPSASNTSRHFLDGLKWQKGPLAEPAGGPSFYLVNLLVKKLKRTKYSFGIFTLILSNPH